MRVVIGIRASAGGDRGPWPGALRRLLVPVLLLVTAATASAGVAPAAERPLRIFAAASLKDAMDAVAAQWRADGGGRALITYAASSTLARQIEQGAPADIYMPANISWMHYLSTRGLTRTESERTVLRNRLVLVAPAGRAPTLRIAAGFDLVGALGDGRLAICNPAVPAGSYARQSLQTLAVWSSVQQRTVLAENVRAALRLVSRGEMPLGVVYASDAVADPGVQVVDVFPDDSHDPILYPAAQLATSEHPQASSLLRYLGAAAAGAIFRRWGFEPVAGAGAGGG